MSGSNLNSPYGTIYGPDGESVAALGDPEVRPRRSYSADIIATSGIYTIIVGTAEVDRYGLVGDAEYQLTVQGEEAEPTPEPEVEVPDFTLTADGASEKGVLALNETLKDEIAGAEDRHSYSFEAVAGQELNIKIRTGGGGLSGSNLNSPYSTIYGPDGKFVAALGDPGVRPRRSYNAQVTAKQGTYIIVVGTAEVDRYGMVGDAEYQLIVEGDEPASQAEAEEPSEPVVEATLVPVPEFVLSPEAATDKGALTLDVVSKDEIHEADEKHIWSFEATAGQSVSIKIRTGGGGLSGSNLNSPYATIYGPDGNFVAALGDPGVRPRRSYNAPLNLTSGTYTIVVGTAQVDRYGLVGDAEYQLTVESADG